MYTIQPITQVLGIGVGLVEAPSSHPNVCICSVDSETSLLCKSPAHDPGAGTKKAGSFLLPTEQAIPDPKARSYHLAQWEYAREVKLGSKAGPCAF